MRTYHTVREIGKRRKEEQVQVRTPQSVVECVPVKLPPLPINLMKCPFLCGFVGRAFVFLEKDPKSNPFSVKTIFFNL